MMTPRNFLLLRTDRMGDLLMNLPLVHRIRQNFPESIITVVCDEVNEPLLRRHLDINRLLPVKGSAIQGVKGFVLLWKLLRPYKFDVLVATQPHKSFHLLGSLLGIRIRAGFKRKWGFLLNRGIADRKHEALRHEVDYNQEILDGICPKRWNGQLDLGLDMDPRASTIASQFGFQDGRTIIAFHMLSSDARKEWTFARFRETIDFLRHRPRYQLVLIGKCDPQVANEAAEAFRDTGVLNLLNRTNLTELALLLRKVNCLVTVDSGPMHLAWMQQTPVVAIFFKEAPASNPARWGVYPKAVKHRHFHDNRDNIRPADIAAAAEELSEPARV